MQPHRSTIAARLAACLLAESLLISACTSGGLLDQARYCNDYAWQADTMRQMADLYPAKGTAGFTIFSWRANTYASPEYDKCYSYSIDNTEMVTALTEIASGLGDLNVPPDPLDFVGLLR